MPKARSPGAHIDMATSLRNLVRHVGLPLAEAIAMCTDMPRRVLGLPPQEIGPGTALADLLALDDDLHRWTARMTLRLEQSWLPGHAARMAAFRFRLHECSATGSCTPSSSAIPAMTRLARGRAASTGGRLLRTFANHVEIAPEAPLPAGRRPGAVVCSA